LAFINSGAGEEISFRQAITALYGKSLGIRNFEIDSNLREMRTKRIEARKPGRRSSRIAGQVTGALIGRRITGQGAPAIFVKARLFREAVSAAGINLDWRPVSPTSWGDWRGVHDPQYLERIVRSPDEVLASA
jgi:hypothetical protein